MIQGLFDTDVVSVTPEQSVKEVVELMRDQKIGDVIVVENDAPKGIITDRDIAIKVFAQNPGEAEQLKVSDVMTTGIVTVKESDYLFDVIDTLNDEGVVRLPVVDEDGKLCGIITDLHCMQALTDALEKVTHINQKDTDESTPPSMPKASKKKNSSKARASIQ